MKRAALILAGLALLMATPASAQHFAEGSSIVRVQNAPPRLSPPQVWAIIQRMTPGRQLNTSLVEGRAIYMVRWQTNDGRRIDYVIDGNSGAVLSRNGG